MIKVNFNSYSSYITESLYQWDINRVLTVTGLHLDSVPEVHFSNSDMARAIVRQATTENNVISVKIPNTLLQYPLTIKAHIGIYEDDTFKVVELIEIPVIPKKKPLDYVFEDTEEEIYSFNELENRIHNIITNNEQVKAYVEKWLDDHPEATSTVKDESLVVNKFSNSLKLKTVKDYFTPQMFGAKGDGSENDRVAIQNAINSLHEQGGGVLLIPNGSYDVSGGEIVVKSNVKIIGIGNPILFSKSTKGYFALFRNDNVSLDNVEISGLTVEQWDEMGLQPNNDSIPCCCIAFLGKCSNIVIKDNMFNSIGGWTISVTDTVDNYGSNNVHISNNKINWKQAGNGTWYDASAIYVESDNHIIERNYIESFIGSRDKSSRWKSEGGIETHGVGSVKWNEIRNVQAGINIVEHAYDRTTLLKAKRELAYNVMRGVNRGFWFWIPQKPFCLENIEIYSNDVEVIAEGYYPGNGAICCTLTEKNYTDTDNIYNGYLKDIKIYNNKFYFVDNIYTGSEYFDLKNVGGISLASSGIVKNVEIYNNEIDNFPWPAIVTYQWDPDVSRYYNDINVYNNVVCDCGYGMSNDYQKLVFAMNCVNRVFVHDNTIKWVNTMTTLYLISGDGDIMEFINNKQISENGFTLYSSLVSSKFLEKTGVFIDTKNLGYRTYSGNPTGNLMPKKIGERVYDTTYKRWFVSVGETSSDWRIESAKESGVATMPSGATSVNVPHGLVYVPNNVLITPFGDLGNVYVSFRTTNYFTITCSKAPTSNISISYEVAI